jgi:glyoxylase-like metal-dependent hydrolase (beta-lactamase superfamily II)
MPTTSPTRLSYDVFVSDGPAGAGGERMPDGAPLAWSPLSSTLIFGGGETPDALMVHLPASGLLFTGDALMPYLGVPFTAEGQTDRDLTHGATKKERRLSTCSPGKGGRIRLRRRQPGRPGRPGPRTGNNHPGPAPLSRQQRAS